MENMLYLLAMMKFLNFLKLINSLKNILITWKMLQCLMQSKSFLIILDNLTVSLLKYTEQLMVKSFFLTNHF